MKKENQNAQTVEATEATTKVSNQNLTQKELIELELKEKRELLNSIKKDEAAQKKAREAAEKKELQELKKDSISELREKLFSLTQLVRTVKQLAETEALFLAVYCEKNGMKLENITPEFVAKNYPLVDVNGVCLRRVNLYKFNEQYQKNEPTGFFYYSKKQYWSVSDIVNSVNNFLRKKQDIKNTEFLYCYELDKNGKRFEKLTNFELKKD